MRKTPITPILCEVTDPQVAGLSSYSPYCEKVHRGLRFAAIEYERRQGAYPGVFKQLNPTGKVPVLLVGERVLPDSTAILKWIDERKDGVLTPFQGPDAHKNAEAWLWEEFGDTTINGFLIAARWADPDNWQRLREAFFGEMPLLVRKLLPGHLRKGVLQMLKSREVWTAHNDCWPRFDSLLEQLEARAPREGFWMGEQLSVADLGIFAQLQSFFTPLTPRQSEQIAARTPLRDYLGRVDAATSRPQPLAKAA